jgi:hypothetical protein
VTAESANRYKARLLQLLEYIDTHLDEELHVDRQSKFAAFRRITSIAGFGSLSASA